MFSKKSSSSATTSSTSTAASGQSAAVGAPPSPKSKHWDPLSCRDWDNQDPSPIALNRIKRDLSSFFTDPPAGIFIVPDEKNVLTIHALVIGPYDTPYEGGFFIFLVRCPPDYPIHPPRVRLMTTGGGRVRFNPNLYADGKVCLSILGTWTGPAWTPTQSFGSVLISIQIAITRSGVRTNKIRILIVAATCCCDRRTAESLMNEKPYHNEPGFETEHRPGDALRYNRLVSYNTVRVAVCDALDSTSGTPPALLDVMRASFLQYYTTYLAALSELDSYEGSPLADPFGENTGQFWIKALRARLSTLWKSVSALEGEAGAPEPTLETELELDAESGVGGSGETAGCSALTDDTKADVTAHGHCEPPSDVADCAITTTATTTATAGVEGNAVTNICDGQCATSALDPGATPVVRSCKKCGTGAEARGRDCSADDVKGTKMAKMT